MAKIDDVIESLSPEELDLLNSDPQMLAEFKAKYAPDSVAKQNLADLDGKGPIDDLVGAGKAAWDVAKKVGKEGSAGWAGIADLIAHPNQAGLDKAVENIGHVEKGEDVTSAPATFGEALGNQVTPVQIALQAGGAKIAELIGPAVANLMKGWASDVALNAVGKIKSIANSLGVTNLDKLGQFLLTPIKIGSKEFEPIVTATSSPQAMLDQTNAMLSAAGKQLEAVSKTVNGVISGVTDESGMTLNVANSVLDLNALTKSVEELKQEAVGDLPNLGKAVAKQYDDAMKDLTVFIQKQAEGDTKTMFSDLAAIKTKIGGLVYKHGSPLESKAALNDVYHVISDALDQASKHVGGENGAAYDAANAIYHQLMAVKEGLEGKVVDAKKLFDAPAFLTAMSAGLTTMGAGHGILAGITAPLAYAGAKFTEKYGPQVAAQGLEKGAPLVAKGLQITARGIPIAVRGVVDGLNAVNRNEDQ